MASSSSSSSEGNLLETTSSKPRLLIVGASFGGLGLLWQLRKNRGIQKFDRITLVDAKDYFVIGGTWQFVWNDRIRSLDQVQWPLSDASEELLAGIDVRLNTRIVKWDVLNKSVTLDDGTSLTYDDIVLACGVVPDPKSVPGLEEHVNICSFDHVLRQKEELQVLIEKAKTNKVTFVLGIGAVPYKCPPAPFEVTLLVDEALRKANVRENVRIVMTCPIQWPMPLKTRDQFEELLKERDIEFWSMHAIARVENGTIHFENGKALQTTLLWSVYPIRAPDFVQEVIPCTKGFVTVKDKSINTIPNIENAFAIGDCCHVPIMENIAALMPKAFARPYVPKNGEFAWKMGISVANALANDIQPADRSGKCIAETGCGRGLLVNPDFSACCNDPESGKPTVKVEFAEEGVKGKITWVNSYLVKVFGDNARTLSL